MCIAHTVYGIYKHYQADWNAGTTIAAPKTFRLGEKWGTRKNGNFWRLIPRLIEPFLPSLLRLASDFFLMFSAMKIVKDLNRGDWAKMATCFFSSSFQLSSSCLMIPFDCPSIHPTCFLRGEGKNATDQEPKKVHFTRNMSAVYESRVARSCSTTLISAFARQRPKFVTIDTEMNIFIRSWECFSRPRSGVPTLPRVQKKRHKESSGRATHGNDEGDTMTQMLN